MKTKECSGGLIFSTFILLLTASAFAGSELQHRLKLSITTNGVVVSWPAGWTNAANEVLYPEHRLERSTDLVNWKPVTGALRGIAGRSSPEFSLQVNHPTGPVFFRVKAYLNAPPVPLGEDGGEVFGYASAFDDELDRIGFMDVATFDQSYPRANYLQGISFDPTEAKYWTNFNSSASFQLNDAERERFMTNGFVVSERLGAASFGDIYYRIFTNDLPVFISTDSIFQAWHRSFVLLLEELEQLEFANLLRDRLERQKYYPSFIWWLCEEGEFGPSGPLRGSILDADYLLTVARSLLYGRVDNVVIPGQGTEARVAATLADIETYQLKEVAIFGGSRLIDFSQFIPRGHYTRTPELQRYFKAMQWCSLADLRLATFPPNKEDDLRQLGTALVLYACEARWDWDVRNPTTPDPLDQVLNVLIGQSDSMTFEQLGDLLDPFDFTYFYELNNLTTLSNIQTKLLTGEYGMQAINGHPLFSPLNPEELKLPRSFAFSGKRFAVDSWAFSETVFDRVHWPANDGETILFNKVIRRKPSCLDVAFAVFGNNAAVPEIVDRILSTNGVAFRDGLPYQHNLAAARNVIDSQNQSGWTNTIYTRWLDVIRDFSTTLPEQANANKLPEAMRTAAWAMKDLNTQMAAWTQLRHDTMLYVKQSYTPPLSCEYPAGFVEPRPEFFSKMRLIAEALQTALSGLPQQTGTNFIATNNLTVNIEKVRPVQLAFLTNFASTMATLEGIARQEVQQQPLSQSQTEFIQSTMEYAWEYVGERKYHGWYPQLYYSNVFSSVFFHKDAGCDYPDGLVVDVHTDVPDDIVGDPGAVIHEGVGNVNLLMIAVDSGQDRAVYAGPVLSHYEFEMPANTRLTDEEWKDKISSGQAPPVPPWTKSYLVTKP